MPSKDRRKAKGRRESAPFLMLPHPVTGSENYCKLSHTAARMLIELARQFNGSNNGDLCATARTLAPRGWTSNGTITRALRELEYFGFIETTRRGGLNRCSLYAVTWKGIDECGGKLDLSQNPAPSNAWKIPKPPLKKARRRIENAAAVRKEDQIVRTDGECNLHR